MQKTLQQQVRTLQLDQGKKSLHIYLWGKAKTRLPVTGACFCLLLFSPPPGFARCHPTATGSVSNWVEAAFYDVETVFAQKMLAAFLSKSE